MKPTPHSPPTTDELKRYAAGELSPAEQHDLERRLLQHPLESAAAEGFEQLHADGLSTDAPLQDLRLRLRKRTEQATERKVVIPLWRYASVAAGIVVVLSVGYWLSSSGVASKEGTLSKAAATMPPLAASTDSVTVAEGIEQADEQAVAFQKSAQPTPKSPNEPVGVPAEAPPPAIEESTVLLKESKAETPPPAPAAAPVVATDQMTKSTTPTLTAIGQVLDSAERVPLRGVTISIAGTNKGTTTDADGRFKIPSLSPGQRLMLGLVGYERQEVVVRNEAMPTVLLRADTTALAEVVAVASKKRTEQAKSKVVATPPRPPDDFEEYLRSNQKLPEAARQNGVSGVVEVAFEVDAKGRLSNFVIRQSLGYGCDQEAIRLLKASPRWLPAERQGKQVMQQTSWSIKF